MLTIVIFSILIASHSISELDCDRATVDQVASCDTKVAMPSKMVDQITIHRMATPTSIFIGDARTFSRELGSQLKVGRVSKQN